MPVSSVIRRNRSRPGSDDPDYESGPILLELDLTEPLLVAPPPDPVAAIRARRRTRLDAVLAGLRRAAADPDVGGLIAKVSGGGMGFATAQEIRDAVAGFRAGGKRAVAYAESFGEFASGTAGYYLATAFDEVWLAESGDVGLVGIAGQAFFARAALDKAGVDVEVSARYEYKNAPNMLTETGFTGPHREAVTRLVSSTGDQIVDGIAAARSLSAERVRRLVAQSPLSATAALEAGLVDHVGYRDEVYDDLRVGLGGKVRLKYLSRYHRGVVTAVAAKIGSRARPKLGLVYAVGGVRSGRSGRTPAGATYLGSDTIGAALRAAVRDDDVHAIVLRVDSPGGSYIASDTIRRDVLLARRAGKPVVASMGDVAGSGGYYIAMAADTIVASQATLTGSIGVFGGKPVLSQLLDRIGIAAEQIADGPRAGMFSVNRKFSADERSALEAWLDRVYDDFTNKAAMDRGLGRDRLHELARGRIWTGADAQQRGLVDVLGGLETALSTARHKAGMAARSDRDDVRVFPKIGPVDRLRGPKSSLDPAADAAAAALFAGWGPFADLATAMGLPTEGPLVVPGHLMVR